MENAVSEKHESALAASVREATGVDVVECYQCGKCTAGCPMARFMDVSPSQVMRFVQIGDEPAADRVLRSEAIWSCAGCLTCTQRCPQGLDPAAVIDALREISYIRGLVSPAQRKVLAFHESFLNTVEKGGRMSEVPLVRRYKMSTMDLFSDVMLVPPMLRRGKLPLLSHKIKGRGQVRRIFEVCRRGKGGHK